MTRADSLLALLERDGHDAILLSNLDNLRYLSGYTGHAANIIVCAGGRHLITDYRYSEQARDECPDFEVIQRDRPTTTLGQSIDAVLRRHGLKKVAFEQDHMTYGQFREIEDDITEAELVPASGLVEELRYVKDPGEIDALTRAAAIADRALARVLDEVLKVGVTEAVVARQLEGFMIDLGAEGPAFETILLAGARSSLPHGVPGDKVIEQGDLVLFDFGARVDGYGSDMTRTVVMGEPDAKQREIYDTVQAAEAAGVAAVRAGITGREPYEAARAVLEQSPYIEWAGEGLGHGVGLFLHEQPFMDQNCERILEAGCVVTVEPGIYIPGWGGVRIEDDVVITADGCEIITHAPRDLIVIG